MKRFQISLRLLLLLGVLVAVTFAGIGSLVQTERLWREPLYDRIAILEPQRQQLAREINASKAGEDEAARTLAKVDAEIVRLKNLAAR